VRLRRGRGGVQSSAFRRAFVPLQSRIERECEGVGIVSATILRGTAYVCGDERSSANESHVTMTEVVAVD
jgi:hypothetical protein